ncbi:MAG: patatin-like phospholipase family protein [Gammaproteobacteria bacterium]|nr:patatin-like phospholipase family protein [Gammaproteobacteria bacterium]
MALTIATCLVSNNVAAQDALVGLDEQNHERPNRLRVGVVLGGGGARGAAHVGVLQELERMHIPIDAIVGTSIGAIVGGLYSSGMGTAELEQLIATLDWAEALSDTPERSDLSFRRKQDDREFPVNLELGLRDGELQLPQGVIQGQKLDLLLRELTIDVSNVKDFDYFQIPFRAIASDLVSGRPYVMGEGDLATAIRASMTVPGAMAPVAIDNRLLVDGGLVGNLAVSVMQQMNVDVIIAVDVEFPLYRLEELTSALAISEQVLTILIRNETLRQIERLGERDILITPDLGTFASTDFVNSIDTLQPGILATQAKADRLRHLSLDDAEYASHLAARRTETRRPQTIDFFRVVDESGESVEQLEKHLQLNTGDPIDPQKFSAEANRLFGLRAFEKVEYQLVEEQGKTGVEFATSARSWGPTYLRFGLSIEDDFEGSTGFNFATRLWQPGVNRLGGEWRSDLRIGTLPLLASEFYQPVSLDSHFFVAPNIELSQRNFDSFVVDDAIARLRVSEARLGLDVGAALSRWGEFRLGAYYGAGNARVKVGDPGIPNLSFDIGGAFARLQIDSFDDANFPRHGTRGEILWNLSRHGLGADDNYEILEIDMNSAFSRGKSTFVAGIDFATSQNADAVVQAHVPLGGFLRLSGLERGQLSGPHAGVMRLVYYRRIGDSAGGLIEVPVYVGASIEAGNVWQSRDDIEFDSLLTNGSVFFGLDTYLGPVFLAAGFAEGGGTNFYLFIGALPD